MTGNCTTEVEKDFRRINRAIRDLFSGRSNAAGNFTLRASQTTTTVNAPNCGANSEILFTPKTANAAAEIGNGTIYVSSVIHGAFVVTHASGLSADRTFSYRLAE